MTVRDQCLYGYRQYLAVRWIASDEITIGLPYRKKDDSLDHGAFSVGIICFPFPFFPPPGCHGSQRSPSISSYSPEGRHSDPPSLTRRPSSSPCPAGPCSRARAWASPAACLTPRTLWP